jgi:hypothetical protein
MGHTNQDEIYKNQRRGTLVQMIFELKKTKDKLGLPEFRSEPNVLPLAMKFNELIELVSCVKDRQ